MVNLTYKVKFRTYALKITTSYYVELKLHRKTDDNLKLLYNPVIFDNFSDDKIFKKNLALNVNVSSSREIIKISSYDVHYTFEYNSEKEIERSKG